MPTASGFGLKNYVTTINWATLTNNRPNNNNRIVAPKFLNTNNSRNSATITHSHSLKFERNVINSKNKEGHNNKNSRSHSVTRENSYFSLNQKDIATEDGYTNENNEIDESIEDNKQTNDYEIVNNKKSSVKTNTKELSNIHDSNKSNNNNNNNSNKAHITTTWSGNAENSKNNKINIDNKAVNSSKINVNINNSEIRDNFLDNLRQSENKHISNTTKINNNNNNDSYYYNISKANNKIVRKSNNNNNTKINYQFSNEPENFNNIILEIRPSQNDLIETIEQNDLSTYIFKNNSKDYNQNQNLSDLYSIKENADIYLYRTKSVHNRNDRNGYGPANTNYELPPLNVDRRPSSQNKTLNNNKGNRQYNSEVYGNARDHYYDNASHKKTQRQNISRGSDDSVAFTEMSSFIENDSKYRDSKINHQSQKKSTNRKSFKNNHREIQQTPSVESEDDYNSENDDNLKIDQKGDLKFFIKPRKIKDLKKKEQTIENDIDEEKLKSLLAQLMKAKNNDESKLPANTKQKSKSKKVIKTEETTGDKGYTIYLDKSGTGGGLGESTLKNMSSINRIINQNEYYENNNNNIIDDTFQSTMHVMDNSNDSNSKTNNNNNNNKTDVNRLNSKKQLENSMYDGPYHEDNNNASYLNNRNTLQKAFENSQYVGPEYNSLNNTLNNTIDQNYNSSNGNRQNFDKNGKNGASSIKFSKNNHQNLFMNGKNQILLKEPSTHVATITKTMETMTSDLVDKRDQATETLNEQQTQTETVKDFTSLQTQTDPMQIPIQMPLQIPMQVPIHMSNVSQTKPLFANSYNSKREFVANSNLNTNLTTGTNMSNVFSNNGRFYKVMIPQTQSYNNSQLMQSINYNGLGKALMPIMNDQNGSKIRVLMKSPKTQYVSADQLNLIRQQSVNYVPNNIQIANINKTRSSNRIEHETSPRKVEEYIKNSQDFSKNFEKIALIKKTEKHKYLVNNQRKPVKFINI